MRPHLRRLALVLAPAALAVVLTGTPAQAAAPVDYVALGDSYSSGAGAPPYQLNTCFRSSRAYAPLWAGSHSVSSFKFVACGGATTSSMTNQFSSLGSGTDLVTITIGGNDIGFVDTVLACLLGTDSYCVNAVNEGVSKANNELPAKLDATYATIKSRAPNARVIVLGYPRLVEPNGNCFSSAKRTALNRGADILSGVIAGRAAAAGFTYLDARGRFTGHGACGSSPWINGFNLLQAVESFHPNATGYNSGYLSLLNSATG